MSELPRIVVTGASGFLGRRLVALLRNSHRVVAIDRVSRSAADLAEHPRVEWHPIDLADAPAVARVFQRLRRSGGARVVVHLAAWYDFTGEEHPEYQRTNVDALRVLLDHCEGLPGLERFVFASSVAACGFSAPGRPVTEASPPEGAHIYARTKRIGEEMLRDRRGRIPSCIVRFAAMFSDWCEYPPLYVFLDTWLSGRWNARILGGRGESAIPFLHVRDGADFVLRVVGRAAELEPAEILVASTDGAVSHRQLFEAATAYRFGAPRRPLLVPRALARPGMWVRDAAGRLVGPRPFERPWMADYIDTRLEVDASRTRRRLRWAPRARLDVLARVPFMIENKRTNPMEWLRRNREAMEHLGLQPNFLIYRALEAREDELAEGYRKILAGETDVDLPGYRGLDDAERQWIARMVLRNLVQSVRTGEKGAFMAYCRDAAERRIPQGFPPAELVHALRGLSRLCEGALRSDPEAGRLGPAVHDYVTMTIEFGIDRVLEAYEDHEAGSRGE